MYNTYKATIVVTTQDFQRGYENTDVDWLVLSETKPCTVPFKGTLHY